MERIQKYSDPPLETCDKCGGKLTKLFSSPAIQFKGSGWYITDYARKGEAGRKSDAEKAPAGDGTSKTETAAKSDTTSKTDAAKSDAAADSRPAPATSSKE